jgi:arylsulfatase A-like enzyme
MKICVPEVLCERLRRAAAGVVLLAAITGCAPPPPPEILPNILLVVVDTLRADRLGVYGNKRGLSPFLDELTSRGTLFRNAYAPTSWTCPSIASLFTSRYASQHGVNSFEAVLAPDEVTVAEILAAGGYVGAGFSANLRMLEANGYAQGFGAWHAYMGGQAGGHKPRGDVLRRASLAWLRPLSGPEARQPKLLYLQYMEPHTPYEPGEPYRSRFLRGSDAVDEKRAYTRLLGQKKMTPAEVERLESLYDGEVAAVDAELRTLFGELGRLGFLSDAVIVITADHGEEFGEHGVMLHGFTLFNGVMRIPLIIVAPGFPAGRVVEENVSLVDVAPTLLELTGMPPAPTFEGRSLVPLMRSPYSPQALWARLFRRRAPDVIGEIEPFKGPRETRVHAQAIVGGPEKLLVDPQGQGVLYDLQKDPREIEPLQASEPLAKRLAERRAELQSRARPSALQKPIDDATREKLRALGYQH